MKIIITDEIEKVITNCPHLNKQAPRGLRKPLPSYWGLYGILDR